MKRLREFLRARKTTGYYVALISMITLCLSLCVVVLTGGGLFAGVDPKLDAAMHQSPLLVEHEDAEHHQTPLGNLLLGKKAWAHKYPYCGSGTIWRTLDGVLHKIVHVEYYANGDNHIRTAHYKYTGTGYTRISEWLHYRIDC